MMARECSASGTRTFAHDAPWTDPATRSTIAVDVGFFPVHVLMQ